MGGAFSWEEVARYRDSWKGPMALKGILHPAGRRKGGGARRRRHLGVEPWRPADRGAGAVDRLPAGGSSPAVGKKATIVLDSGIRSGQDVMRALALGADAAFAGKSFLWAVGGARR